ncbi:MAG: tRNA (adenosine(37)-N6)-dimethylallyltransferase MiaA [Candidatus Competibacterales bacterium]|nr:tRNA (adenosine(37)-N6)-dimethylallyltransferase MiaA [Candidatus Competibacterales bacterium]
MTDRRPPALFLMGPTAAGKTELALALAERLPVGLISVDSAMVYRGLDIGTAKPDAATRARVPHRLIDILDPAERYSAARFRDDALREMAAIWDSGRLPLLVGGTLLYFRALAEGLSPLPEADPQLRARLDAERQRLGSAALHARLARIDPTAAARIHPNDPQRIQRALEVHALTGQPLSRLQERQPEPFPYRVIRVIVAPAQRATLHARIEQRFERMLAQGFVEEVAGLRARGDLDPTLPALRTVGYRQVWRYLAGETNRATMRQEVLSATRQLAKRQLTWLRPMHDALWVERPDAASVDALVNGLRHNEVFASRSG